MRAARLAVACAAGLIAAGCGVPVERSARTEADSAVPYALLNPDAPPLVRSPAETTADVEMCFVAGRTVVPVARAIEASPSPLDVVNALTSPPRDPPGLTTALPDAALVVAVDVRAGVAQVDLAAGAAAVGSDAQVLLVAQLVCTLTARPGVGQVAFRLDGVPVQVPRSDGSLAPGPVARDDYAGLIA